MRNLCLFRDLLFFGAHLCLGFPKNAMNMELLVNLRYLIAVLDLGGESMGGR